MFFRQKRLVELKTIGVYNACSLKSVIFTALFCLLLCTTELYALDSNKLNPEKQMENLSIDGIAKSLFGVASDIGESLGGVIDGAGQSLDGTVNGIGESLGGVASGVGQFFEDNGEAIVVAGAVFLYIIAEVCYYHHGYGHHYYYYH